MDFYDVEVECMAHCYGGYPKFKIEPYGYGEWAKREDVDALLAERDRLTAENAELKRKYDEVNKNYMGLVNLILPHLRKDQALAIAEGRDNG